MTSRTVKGQSEGRPGRSRRPLSNGGGSGRVAVTVVGDFNASSQNVRPPLEHLFPSCGVIFLSTCLLTLSLKSQTSQEQGLLESSTAQGST